MKPASAATEKSPHESTPADDRLARPRASVRPAAVALGAALLVAQTVLIVRSNLIFDRYISASSLPEVAIFLFFPLAVLNRRIARRGSRLALSARELALV